MPCNRRFAFLVLALMFVPCAQTRAADLAQNQGRASLRINGGKIENGRLHVSLADEISVVLQVEGETPPKVELAKQPSDSVWLVRSTPPSTTELENKTHRWQQSFIYEPQQTDEHSLTVPDLKYQEKDGNWRNVKWQPIQVKVTTQFKNANVKNMRDIAGIEELPAPSFPWMLFAAAGGFATAVSFAALVGLLWLLLRRRPRPRLSEPPEQTALRQLQILKSDLPPAEEAVVPFFTGLAEILCKYLEQKHQVASGFRTTAELLHQLTHTKVLSDAELATLKDIFHRCDLCKFAPLPVGLEECESIWELANSFVERSSNSYNDGTKQTESDSIAGGTHERARRDTGGGQRHPAGGTDQGHQ